jgi:hypothetical protein
LSTTRKLFTAHVAFCILAGVGAGAWAVSDARRASAAVRAPRSVSASAEETTVWELERAYWRYAEANDLTSYLSLWHENFLGWPRLAWRKTMTDEQWVALNAADDETWYNTLERDFGFSVRPQQ